MSQEVVMPPRGVIMDVVSVEEAKIAEAAGAVAVMALERVPSDIRKEGGVARMTDPELIHAIKASVSIPVMAKVRIGHIAEARILEAIGIDYIDESEVLTPADDVYHLLKSDYKVPFVCGCRNLGEALRRIGEGSKMLRTKGEPGTGNIVEAVRHMRQVNEEIRLLTTKSDDELMVYARDIGAPYELIKDIKKNGRLPVVNYAAGGVGTPGDAVLMMLLGADGGFVGSGIFKSENPEAFARAIVQATANYEDFELLAKLSRNLGAPMKGIEIATLDETQIMAGR